MEKSQFTPMLVLSRRTNLFYEMNPCCQEFLLHLKQIHFLPAANFHKLIFKTQLKQVHNNIKPQKNSK